MGLCVKIVEENGHARMRLYSPMSHECLMQEELATNSPTLRTIIHVFWKERVEVQCDRALLTRIMRGEPRKP